MLHSIQHYFDAFTHYVLTHPSTGQFFTFLIAFIESLPLIGTIFPGSVIMTGIGILIGRHLIPLYSAILWSTVGAFIGDALGFWLGKVYKEKIPRIWPFRKYPNLIRQGEDLFKKHGGKSILIGRFVGPLRSSVPLVAGLLKMSWLRFCLAAIPAAFLWSVLYILPGILIGAISLELPPGKTTLFMLMAFFVLIFLWMIFWLIQRFFIFLINAFNHLIDKMWNWLSNHHSSRFLIRLITNQKKPEDHLQLVLICLAFLSLLIFCFITSQVYGHMGLYTANQPIYYLIQSFRNIQADYFFLFFTLFAGHFSILIGSGLVLIVLGIKRQWRAFFHLLALIILTLGAIEFFKFLIHSSRPQDFLKINKSNSFPSGHTMPVLTILGFLAYLTNLNVPKNKHWIAYSVVASFVILVGASRLYLGAHWLTDILASISLGFVILLLVIVSFRRSSLFNFDSVSWSFLLLIAFTLPWLAITIKKYSFELHRYRPLYSHRYISNSDWLANPTQYTPVYLLGRLGKPILPFNVLWKGDIHAIEKNLLLAKWTLLKSTQSFFPLRYRGKPPRLLIIKKQNPTDTLELRLWESGVHFMYEKTPLWIGVLVKRHRQHIVKTHNNSNFSQILPLSSQFSSKEVTLPAKAIKPFNWNNSILIIYPH